MSKAIKVGILGTCPVCEGDFKIQKGVLVHHGFTRPGDGVIHGDCFAVGYKPYEVSAEGCEEYKSVLERSLASQKDYLSRLQTGKVTYFHELRMRWDRSHEAVTHVVGVTEPYTMRRYFESKVREVESQIHGLESEVARMNRLITGWTLKPLREVTEEMAAKITKEAREARAAERAAKKAERDAKRAALDARTAAREAKKEAAFQALINTLKSLDTTETRYSKDELKQAAREAWYAFFSKKTRREVGDISRYYYEFRKRDLETLLINLGLATREKEWVSYTYSTTG